MYHVFVNFVYALSTVIFPNAGLSEFRVTGLKISGRVDTYFFYFIFFYWKKIKLYAF